MGAADTWNDGADAGAKLDGDFGATNGEMTAKEDKPGGDFTCRR